MALASPGVLVKELDLSATVQVSDQNIGVVAIDAEKGPTDVVTYISSERELVEIFGGPNNENYESWFAASTIISYGGIAAVIRPTGDVDLGLRNSNIKQDGTSRTDLLIKNKDDFEVRLSNEYEFAARTAGDEFNGISVVVVDHGADQRITVAPKEGQVQAFDTAVNAAATVRTSGTFSGVAATGGSGNGATFDVTVDATTKDATVALASGGTGYLDGETLTLPATLGWIAGDITVDVDGVDAGTGEVQAIDGETGLTFTDNVRTVGTYAINATGGSGSGAAFSVVVDAAGAATITLTAGGLDYADNEVLTLPATGNYGGSTDITVAVNGVGDLPAAGTYLQWTDPISSGTYKANVFRQLDQDSLEITLWNTTQRLRLDGANVALNDASGTLITTATNIESNDVYGELEYATDRKWISLAPQPGTSASVSARGGKYDEFHIAVVDTDGNVTGVPGTVIEVLSYLSKAIDGRSTEGDSKYWRTVVQDGSKYIYAGDDDFATIDATASPAINDFVEFAGYPNTTVAGKLGETSQNRIFRLFSFGTAGASVESKKLAEGKNYDYSTPTARQTVRDGIVTGYNLVEDPEVFGDIDFLVPGYISASVAVRLINICEKRKDCIAVVSPERADVINSNTSTKKTDDIIDFFNTLPSTSYAIYDSGYKYIYDKYNDVYRYVPCAADVAGLCLSTTINSETWFSPAGYNRGQIRNATKLAFSPKQAERDRLYTSRINPVVAFPGEGIVLFGDKTALASPSAFDRINVRRLFIELEKNIADFSKYQLFEINDELTRAGFRAAVEPYLRGVQGRRGIYDFLVVCDSSNNTSDVIDRNELVAEIYIKPARSINFITITFVATRTGASFSELIN